MTTGVPIFLVSACASGEEFVAAFRRYADKNGLFIPIASPIPAGRRGRFAVTLTDGGVMIEGEADVVSSATTPSVLHGRVGMTLRFVEPDIKSKTVLVELEQARLAMRPQPPSVPPRPAQVPAEPRPKPPTLSGRIDANNALAECVAIGDIEALEATVPQVPKSGGPRFVVPTIPPVTGARPKAPSTPPSGYPAAKPVTTPPLRPLKPSAPPPLIPPRSAIPRPAGTQPPASRPITLPPLAKASGAAPPLAKTDEMPAVGRTSTLLGTSAPAVSSATAQSGPTLVATPITPSDAIPPLAKPEPSITPMSITTVDAPIVTPSSEIAVIKPSLADSWDTGTLDGDELIVDEPVRDTLAMPAMADAVAALARSRSASDELTAIPLTRAAELIQVVGEKDGIPEAVPEEPPSVSRPNATSASGKVALPPPRRTTGNTAPPPIPRQATPSMPLPIVAAGEPPSGSARSTLSGLAPARAPTQLGLPIVVAKRPAPPSGEVPIVPEPPIVAEARPKAVPEVSDEPTDITSVPVVAADAEDSAVVIADPPPADVTPSGSLPGMRKTVMGIAVVPEGVTVLPASPTVPTPMPAEERPVEQAEVEPFLEAAINTAKATISADDAAADEPTDKPVARPPVIEEPSGDWTMIPGAEGPTIVPRKPDGDGGDWTIARDVAGLDGWGQPRSNVRTNTGPPVAMVAGEKPLEVTMTAKAFDIEEETKSGLKVEVDESLPFERMSNPALALAGTPFAPPAAASSAQLPPASSSAQLSPASSPAQLPQASSSAQLPQASSSAQLPQASSSAQRPPALMTPPPGTPQMPPPMARVQTAGSGTFAEYPPYPKHAHVGDSTSMIDTGKKTRFVIIGVSAALAILVGIVLLVVFGLGGDDDAKKPTATVPPVSDAAVSEIRTPPLVVDASVAVEPPSDAAAAIKPVSTDCTVEVTSIPTGAEIVRDDAIVGTTPTNLTLPCGAEVKLVVRKAKFASSTRTVTPAAEGTKLKVSLGKTMLSVKVTSSPPGATITQAGKSLGVTPAMIKLASGETASLTITKTGFGPDTQKITPKQNNQSLHVNLKKKGR